MDALLTTLRVVVSLAAVLGLMWLLARAARRRGAGGALTGAGFAVVGRHALGRSAQVALVRVGDQALVLGVTEHSVRLLAQTAITDVLADAGHLAPATEPALSPRPVLGLPAVSAVLGERPDHEPAVTTRRAAMASSRGTLGARGTVSAASGAGDGASGSPLAGSALSLATWSAALDVLRDRTTRR